MMHTIITYDAGVSPAADEGEVDVYDTLASVLKERKLLLEQVTSLQAMCTAMRTEVLELKASLRRLQR